ncbi:hypothetical protein [Tumebacillus avium]|nr:hypothetical protein [Tumebacillus avium]
MPKQDWFDLDLQVVNLEGDLAADPPSFWSNCDTCEDFPELPATQ